MWEANKIRGQLDLYKFKSVQNSNYFSNAAAGE
jgi:hypothetical protein